MVLKSKLQILQNFGRMHNQSINQSVVQVLNLRIKVMDGSSLTRKSYVRTSDGDPRTGTFPQTWVTMGDTTCNVKGVLGPMTREI